MQLREPVLADASNLFREICAPEVCEFVPPPPPTIAGVERMIQLGIEWRRAGRGFCFVIEPADEAAGIIQFLASRKDSRAVSREAPWEWGFALGSRHWGAGVFSEAAAMALDFAFRVVNLRQVEAWVVHRNHRANAALARLGAKPVFKPFALVPDGRIGRFVKWTISDASLRVNPSSL